MITAPVAANMIAKAALHHDIEPIHRTQGKELMKSARERQAPPSETPKENK